MTFTCLGCGTKHQIYGDLKKKLCISCDEKSNDRCECRHLRKFHNKKEGCMNRNKRGDYRDNLGYCVCIEFFQVN